MPEAPSGGHTRASGTGNSPSREYAGAEQDRDLEVQSQEAPIRKITVGILAVATVAAASLLMRRLRPAPETEYDNADKADVETLYAAGL